MYDYNDEDGDLRNDDYCDQLERDCDAMAWENEEMYQREMDELSALEEWDDY